MKDLFYTGAACLALGVLLAQPASALIYDVHACTPGVNCNVGSHGTSGSSGPTNNDFQQFFATQLGFDTSGDTFTWGTNTNANGYWFGLVDDTMLSIHSSYLWDGAQLLCCTLDEPYAIVDGNDNNLFIGEDVYGVSSTGPLWPEFLAGPGGPSGLPAVPYTLTAHAWSVLLGGGFGQLVQIDNNNRILATGGTTGWLEFDPVSAVVPEPATALMLVPLLAGAFFYRRKART